MFVCLCIYMKQRSFRVSFNTLDVPFVILGFAIDVGCFLSSPLAVLVKWCGAADGCKLANFFGRFVSSSVCIVQYSERINRHRLNSKKKKKQLASCERGAVKICLHSVSLGGGSGGGVVQIPKVCNRHFSASVANVGLIYVFYCVFLMTNFSMPL